MGEWDNDNYQMAAANQLHHLHDRVLGTALSAHGAGGHELPGGDAAYIVGGLVAQTDYTFRVRSVTVNGASLPSESTSATALQPAPEPPSNVTLAETGGFYTLTWTDESDNETGFRVERWSPAGQFLGAVDLPPDSGSHVLSSFTPGLAGLFKRLDTSVPHGHISAEEANAVQVVFAGYSWGAVEAVNRASDLAHAGDFPGTGYTLNARNYNPNQTARFTDPTWRPNHDTMPWLKSRAGHIPGIGSDCVAEVFMTRTWRSLAAVASVLLGSIGGSCDSVPERTYPGSLERNVVYDRHGTVYEIACVKIDPSVRLPEKHRVWQLTTTAAVLDRQRRPIPFDVAVAKTDVTQWRGILEFAPLMSPDGTEELGGPGWVGAGPDFDPLPTWVLRLTEALPQTTQRSPSP